MSIEYVSLAKDIILSIAAIVTSSSAVIGLSKWRAELRGKAYFEVSRGLIRATYKLRDEIWYSRSPFTSASEFPKDYDPLNKTPEKEAKAWAHVFTNRWKPVADAVQEFEAQVLEAEALWGEEVKNVAFELRSCTRTLRAAMESMISNTASDNGDFKSDSDFAKKIKSEVWLGYGGANADDELSDKIRQAVASIEDQLRPHLKRN